MGYSLQTTILLFFVLVFFSVKAESKQYKSTQITINNGLPHNTVECIFKDHDGIMWFGTHNGLSRYNGNTIKTYQYDADNPYSISGNRVLCINEDEQGNLWVGTMANGLNRFDKQTERFYRYLSNREQNSIPNNYINGIKIFSDQSLWVCTENGLARYNKDKDNFRSYFAEYSNEVSTPFNVYDVCEYQDKDIYVATNRNYIYKLHPYSGKFEPVKYTRNPLLGGNNRKHIAEGPDGNLWISAFLHGLIKLNPQSKKSILYETNNSALQSDLLNGVFVFNKDKLWLTTDGDGIIIHDINTGTFDRLQHNPNISNSLFSDKIYNLYIDDQDIVWVATFNEGVNILDPNPLKFNILTNNLGHDFSLEGKSVLSIFEDSKGRIWLGTDGNGLYSYAKNGTIKQYLHSATNKNSLSSNRILSINEDEEGNILLGMFNGGFVILDAEKGQFTRHFPNDAKNSVSSTNVWEILVDDNFNIWLGLLGNGLDLYNSKTKKFIPYGPSSDNFNRINHNNVMGIIKDRDGDLWFGTEGRGINILDLETRQMYYSINQEADNQLSSNNVKCLYQDSKELIWIGTVNGGLNCYNKKNKTMRYYTMKDGLASNIIYSIVEDNASNIWLGTAYGVSKLDRQTDKFTNYETKDGLLGYVCNRNAICKLNNGTILLGTTNGLNVFNPDSIKTIKNNPKPIITNIRINNKIVEMGDSINGRIVLQEPLSSTQKLTITPQDNVLTIDFAALSYTLPKACYFKYKLEGFDDEWRNTNATRNNVTYTNLDAGHYIFKLKAANSDGVWNNNERMLSITVLPTFWGTIWFKLIIGLFILLILYAWYRYKLKLKEEQFLIEKKEHEQKFVHLEKEKLESELNNQTFNILNRNRTLINHKRRLSLLMNKVDEKNKATLNDIIKEIDSEINEEKDWKHIEPRLDKVYNNFMTTLKQKHAKLTQNELRIAAYVRMGLSTKEISELLQKTSKAVDNERYRLRKKLAIPQNDSLKRYLLDLYRESDE